MIVKVIAVVLSLAVVTAAVLVGGLALLVRRRDLDLEPIGGEGEL